MCFLSPVKTNIMKRHNFKELHIWQLGMDIVDDIYSATRDFPKEELFGLSLQKRKSAISIPSNIAEGCGRGTDPQLIHFLNVAQGSAFELETQVYIALRQGYSDVVFLQSIVSKITELQKMIDGFRDRFV
jgi:four helix bundle protein